MVADWDLPMRTYAILNLAHATNHDYGFASVLNSIPLSETAPMTHESKPHEPKAAAPAVEEKARLKDARKVLAEYRKAHSDDPRGDDELMKLPNGPLEIADDHERHAAVVAEKMRRLRASHPKE